MKSLFAVTAAAALLAHAPAHEQTPLPAVAVTVPAISATLTTPTARLPGFAAVLADRPLPTSPAGWPHVTRAEAWEAIARSTPADRQAARWALAMSYVADAITTVDRDDLGGFASDALGVLDTMARDDPDLMLVPHFRYARAIALVRVRRGAEALTMLEDPQLFTAPEACLWRMMALSQIGKPHDAMATMACAAKAINARKVSVARPFLLVAAQQAVAVSNPATALHWLSMLGQGDPAANLLRGKALRAAGDPHRARILFERVIAKGTIAERADAQVSLIEVDHAFGRIDPEGALKALDGVAFTWRGDAIETRALELGQRIAAQARNDRGALRFGAALLRYHDGGDAPQALLTDCRMRLLSALAPESKVPLGDALGMFWDFRDFAPQGAQGDALLSRLADRLADAHLYERAADLLSYQMNSRALDIEKGPVSIRVARYFILAGKPDKAVLALRASDQPVYPQAMLSARRRMQAVALFQMGRTAEAVALLDDTADSAALRAEMLWRRRDWQGMAALGTPGGGGSASAVGQALVLRSAVALAMLGRDADLARLRARHGAAMARTPSAAAFALLTGPVDGMTSEGLARAMAAIPSASVIGPDEELLDARPRVAAGPRVASAR